MPDSSLPRACGAAAGGGIPAVVVLFFAVLHFAAACLPGGGSGGSPPRQERGVGATGIAYVDETACAACHEAEHRAWTGSHHDLAMQPATPETVLGDFGDATFSRFGVTSRFFAREGRFFVNTEGADGALADFELTHTFGAEPLQQYLAPFPGGRLQSLPIAWDTRRGAWFHLHPDERIAPGDPLHWTGRYQTWNAMCAACHSTNVRKNYDVASDTYGTVWDAIDVGCQACHGPGGRHVERARGERSGPAAGGAATGLAVDLGQPPAETEIEACAGCHSHRQRISPSDRHARPFLDDFLPSTLRDGLYYPDGQIRDEVYVWGSFAQSSMHRAGVRCSNCHDPHSLDLRFEGNALCLQCHRETPDARFPTLQPGRYDTPAHHFHEPESTGAQCVGCHMPARTYMVVDARRDHSLRAPRPDLSVAHGTPNACTLCHTDETDAWAAARAAEWWGAPRTPHFAGVLAAARRGDPAAETGLRALVRDRKPAADRAGHRARAPPAVRSPLTGRRRRRGRRPGPAGAGRGGGRPGACRPRRRIAALAPLLDDPVRAVRIEAARALTSVPRNALDPREAPRFEAARAELVDAQAASADLPGAHLNLGVLHSREGDPAEAERAYRRALRFDPGFAAAALNLANLLNRQGRNVEAEAALRETIERAPEEGELHYSLGLLLAEEERDEDAAASLGRAARLLPAHARVGYNQGLVLQRLGRVDAAEAALVAANAVDPRDPDVLAALVHLLLGNGDHDRALAYAEALQQLDPAAAGPQRLLEEVRRRAGRP